jgi:hypothetical protein
MKFLILIFCILNFLACDVNSTSHKKGIDSTTTETNSDATGINEIRLGVSRYWIQLPSGYELLEARGKEGQLGYNITPKDTASKVFGFVEILHGEPIGENVIDTSAKTFLKSFLLNKEVQWTVDKSETEYFMAYTTEKGDVNAKVFSNKRNEIDSMIAIISTLKEK